MSMKKLTLGLLAFCLTGVVTGNASAEQSPETAKCATAIVKESDKFQKNVYKKTRSCLIGIIKCEGEQVCNEKLLLIDEGKAKGKCALGKLSEDYNFFGNSSSDDVLETHGSKIARAHYKYIGKLTDKCSVPGVVFEGPDGIIDPTTNATFTFTPANAFALGDHINAESTQGAACKGIIQIRVEYPDFQNQIELLAGVSNLDNLAHAVIAVYDYNVLCN
jgi:hypothetical protein